MLADLADLRLPGEGPSGMRARGARAAPRPWRVAESDNYSLGELSLPESDEGEAESQVSQVRAPPIIVPDVCDHGRHEPITPILHTINCKEFYFASRETKKLGNKFLNKVKVT